MKYSASELKKLTGKATRATAESALYAALESRQWHRGGQQYQVAGYDRRKDLVHFTATWARDGGGAFHRRVGVPLRLAVEGNGDLEGAVVLH